MRSYLCVKDIDFASFREFFFRILELFRRYGIFLFLISQVADVIDVCFLYVVPVVLLLFVFIHGY
jgi:hypothetical protein